VRIGIDAGPLLTDRPGGVEVYLGELVTRMPRIGCAHEFRLYFNYTRARHGSTVERFTGGNVRARVCRIPPQATTWLHWRLGVPVDWLAGGVDVMFYPSFAVLPQRRGRAVVTIHDLIPLTHPEFCEPEHVRDFRARVPGSVARADAVIVVSDYTGQLVQEHFRVAGDRVREIPNGVHERFRPPTDGAAAARVAARYGIRTPYFLFTGTMEPRKNVCRLVEAFARARGAAADHALVLAGKAAWQARAIEETVARLGLGSRVVLPGYVAVADLPALYGAATAFLFPSLVEGFGIPPLEAMACGCPALASAIPALAEVLGEAALTVDPEDVEAIASGIERLAGDAGLRETLRGRGLRRASEFSWDRTAAETLAVLEGR